MFRWTANTFLLHCASPSPLQLQLQGVKVSLYPLDSGFRSSACLQKNVSLSSEHFFVAFRCAKSFYLETIAQ
jgi:hypothetical protein